VVTTKMIKDGLKSPTYSKKLFRTTVNNTY